MKIIDLLNKKTNGEKLPKFIKYNNEVWMYANWDGDYQSEDDGAYLLQEYQPFEMLNDEIEIIEDKKIERLDYSRNLISNEEYIRTGFYYGNEPLTENERILMSKINEIIDYINNK